MQYEDWNGSGFKREMLGVRGHDVEPRYQCVLYSGPGKEHGYHGLRNRDRAERFAAREGMITIHKTARGNSLASRESVFKRRATKIMGEYGAEQALTYEWIVTSRNLAAQAHGDVKAFVAGARKKDVFRKAELPQLLQNSRVRTINGIPLEELRRIASTEKDRKNRYDKVFHLVAMAGAHQDMQQAIRTGDQALIRDALAQIQMCVNQRRIEHGKTLDDSKEAKAKRNIKLNRRADHIATKIQTVHRAEAYNEAEAHIKNRLDAGHVVQGQAEQMLRRTAKSVQDPQKAYRMLGLVRLKRMYNNIIRDESGIHSINHYLNNKEQYEMDLRAVRQANGQRFAASNPTERKQNRRHLHRSMAEHARLKCQNKRGQIKNYAQAEQELDKKLQDQRRQETEGGAKPFISRPQPRIRTSAAHLNH